MAKEKIALVAGSIIAKTVDGKTTWFLTKQAQDKDWELPKATVRRGESSVARSIRNMAEAGGIRAKVLEEAGRVGGAVQIGGKPVTQNTIYYLMLFREGGEILGFADSVWLDYAKALAKLTSKKEQNMLTKARDILKEMTRQKSAALADEEPQEEVEEEG
jgi:hypothetical protein